MHSIFEKILLIAGKMSRISEKTMLILLVPGNSDSKKMLMTAEKILVIAFVVAK